MTVTLAVLGDSIAYGQGARQPSDAIGPRLAVALTASGLATTARSVAVPGARSDALAAQVRQVLPSRPELAVIVVGANDLSHFVPPDIAAGQLGAAVRALVGAGTAVVVAPAPDLGVVPWVPPQLRPMLSAASAQLRAAQTRAATAAGARVTDLGVIAERFATDLTLFSADRFHPSSAGYALIAAALAPALRAAAGLDPTV